MVKLSHTLKYKDIILHASGAFYGIMYHVIHIGYQL